MARPTYTDVSEAAGRGFIARNLQGGVVMLNLLCFRDVADYSGAPELAPDHPISGREAYDRYIAHTLPHLEAAGGEIVFMGEGGDYLIGPEGQGWDLVVLVRQRSVKDFLAFAANEAYLGGIGHRTAAIADSRLLPLAETDRKNNKEL